MMKMMMMLSWINLISLFPFLQEVSYPVLSEGGEALVNYSLHARTPESEVINRVGHVRQCGNAFHHKLAWML